MESWKFVPNNPQYMVSDLGRVLSVGRTVVRKNGIALKVAERILKPSIGNHGYPVVNLSLLGKATQHTVHTLVALLFLGDRPDGLDVCHDDGNPQNCALSNLRYDSRLENVKDSQRHGTAICGERVGNAKITEADARAIFAKLLAGEGVMSVARAFKLSHPEVIGIREGKRWGHLGLLL